MLRHSVHKLAMGLAIAAAGAAHAADDSHTQWSQIERYCFDCHNTTDWAGSVAFDTMSFDGLRDDARVWEAAVRKMRAGFMPPPSAKERPDPKTVSSLLNYLETRLDAAQATPSPGRVPLRRLNQREYANAMRDLLGLEVDVAALLPTDQRKDAFDNDATHLQVSPSYLDQYLSAARNVAQLAMGNTKALPVSTTYGQVADMVIALAAEGLDASGSQLIHKEGMPFGTRGGISFRHDFPAAGEYALTIGDLASGRQIPRMEFINTVVALLDGKEFYRTDVGGERDQKAIDQTQEKAVEEINARLRDIRFHAPAGQHTIAVTFLKRANIESEERFPSDPPEGGEVRQAFLSALQVRGPFKVDGQQDSASRRKIFSCYPSKVAEEAACAREIVGRLAQRAFRRQVEDEQLQPLLAFYEEGYKAGGFEPGVRNALTAILASPYFLYRVESSGNGATRTLTDVELASRMSFFMWGSIPDDELLAAAMRGEFASPAKLDAQVHRMLADPKAKALSSEFGFQWLNLAKMNEIEPDARLFPNATGTLDARPLLKRELELFLDSVLRSDQPVTTLLTADYTYLNETLAMLYGIGNVKGGQFRRVTLADSKRYGLLGKGAVLMVTAYPNRTSPVLRGSFILDRLLGSPPYQPPPGVDVFKEDARGAKPTTLRERLEQHTKNPTCFACHGVMDPLGFALENFDTVGQYRPLDVDTGGAVDTAGVLPDGTKINGPDDLRNALVARSGQFVQTVTEQLMTYALGRPLDHNDIPVARQIVRNAARDDNRFASIVSQVVASDAFRRREAPPTAKAVTAQIADASSHAAGGQ
jgi:hypothetical protein